MSFNLGAFLKKYRKGALVVAGGGLIVFLIEGHKLVESLVWMEGEIAAVIKSAALVDPRTLEVNLRPWLVHATLAGLLTISLLLLMFLITLSHRSDEIVAANRRLGELEAQVQSENGRVEELRSQIAKLEKEREGAISHGLLRKAIAEKTLSRMMDAAYKITQQMTGPYQKKKILEIDNSYLIHPNYDGQIERKYSIRAIEALHFWEIKVVIESDASPQDFLDDIDFKVRDDKGESIFYLPTENGPHSKFVALFFLPPLKPDEEKTIFVTYKWPGMFRLIEKQGFERFEWDLTKQSSEIIPRVKYSFFTDPALGKRADASICGWTGGTQALKNVTHPTFGWNGRSYEIANATAGTYMLRVDVR
jgi:hypothetical protein